MIHLSNSEIASQYGISDAAVSFWVQGAAAKKNNLELILVKDKYKVVDNAHNHAELYQLAQNGKKYNRKRDRIEITPSEDFYQIFDENEIVEIVRDLEVFSEINIKFSYKSEGAQKWDEVYNEGTDQTPVRVIDVLDSSIDLILQKIDPTKPINLVEIGPGNSKPIKSFLDKISKLRRVQKYVAVDISQEMIDISRKNINSWFPSLEFTSYKLDIENTKFTRYFEEIKIKSRQTDSVNLVLDLGGTIGNHKCYIEVLGNIQSGLGKDDLFILSNNLETKENKPLANHQKSSAQNQLQLWDLKKLGFDVEECEVDFRYDEVDGFKIKSLVLDKGYSLKIKELGVEKFIEFEKDQKIGFFKYKMTNSDNLFPELGKVGLNLVGYNTSSDLRHALMITKIRR
jgi:hypothetical protein